MMKLNLKHFSKFYRKYRISYFYLLIFQVIFFLCNIVSPILLKNIIDSVLYSNSFNAIFKDAVLYLLVIITQVSTMYYLNFLVMKNVINGSNFRESLSFYSKCLSLNAKSISENSTEKFLNVLTIDIPRISRGVYLGRLQVFANLFFSIMIIATLFSLSVRLTVLVILSIILFVISTFSLRKKLENASRNQREEYQRHFKGFKEFIESYKVSKQYTSYLSLKHELFDIPNYKWSKAVYKNDVLEELSYKLNLFIREFGKGIVIGFGAYLVWKKELSVGTLVAFNSYMVWIYDAFRMLFMAIISVIASKPNWDKYVDVYSLQSENASGGPLIYFENLKLDSVSFSYDSKQVLKDINLTLKKGEKIAIVANSGNGKSTLVSLFNAFLLPSSGNVFLNDTPIQLYSFDSLRRKIITVSSKDYLFDTSVRNNLTLFEDFSEEEIRRVLDICECQFVYEMENGLDTVIGEEGSMLSDGQKQRITIARALLRKPEVLILDEATSGIDSETEEKILNKIMEEIKTVVIISHRLSTIKKAEKIYVMHEGKIEDYGTHEELISKNSRYLQIISSQV